MATDDKTVRALMAQLKDAKRAHKQSTEADRAAESALRAHRRTLARKVEQATVRIRTQQQRVTKIIVDAGNWFYATPRMDTAAAGLANSRWELKEPEQALAEAEASHASHLATLKLFDQQHNIEADYYPTALPPLDYESIYQAARRDTAERIAAKVRLNSTYHDYTTQEPFHDRKPTRHSADPFDARPSSLTGTR